MKRSLKETIHLMRVHALPPVLGWDLNGMCRANLACHMYLFRLPRQMRSIIISAALCV